MHPYFKKNYHYCPKCGSKMKLSPDQEHFICPECKFEVYPNPAPTVSVFFVRDNKILLAKRAIDPGKGKWDSVGGFVDTEESLEQAALRETLEEIGCEAEFIKFISSYPDNYDGKPTLSSAVAAKIISGEPQPADDVASLHWIDINDIPDISEFAFEPIYYQLQDFINQLSKD